MRLIDADELKGQFSESGAYTCKGIREIIDNAPTIDSLDLYVHIGGRRCGKRQRLLDELRPKGKWEYRIPNVNKIGSFWCSLCNYNTLMFTHNYCPNCGADMRGDV